MSTALFVFSWFYCAILAAIAGRSVSRKEYGHATFYALSCVSFTALVVAVAP